MAESLSDEEHRIRYGGGVCEQSFKWGPNKGQPRTGTETGYSAHQRAGERPCDPCWGEHKRYQREWAAAKRDKDPGWVEKYRRRDRERKADKWANDSKWAEEMRRKNRERTAHKRATNSKWVAEERRRCREARAEKRANNAEEERRKERAWRKTPKGRETTNRNTRNRKARLKGIPGKTTVTLPELKCFFGDKCVWCGVREATQIDHIIPPKWGGTNYDENLAPACQSCNSSKKDKHPIPWLTARERRGEPIGPLAWEIASGVVGYTGPQLSFPFAS